MATTVQVTQDVKKMLDELKIYPRESYNAVIKRLLQGRTDQEALSEETIQNIEHGLEDVKAGRIYSTSEVRKRLGIK